MSVHGRIGRLERIAAPPLRRDGACSCQFHEIVILRAGETVPPTAMCVSCGLPRPRYLIREVLGPTRMVALGCGSGAAKLLDAEGWEGL